ILLIILYFTKINAQNLIPSKNFSAQKNFSPEKIYKEFTSGEQESSPKETDDFETLVKYYNRNKKDDLHKTECENALKFIKNKLMDSSRKQSPFKLLGNAGAGNITADNLQKTIGSMSIGCQVRIGPYYLSESESYVNSWYIYALWNTKIGTSSDSSILQKNVLF
ncbi:hypothetical protein, partial [Thermococcus sp. M36]|uniref:hypothetical protein n=1 Tax=Thermococcus sp. M36 TaxID=1638261 RepID=UPI001439EBAD